MKKLFILLLILPLFGFAEDEVTPFMAPHNPAGTPQATDSYGHTDNASDSEARSIGQGAGPKVCPDCVAEAAKVISSTKPNFTPGNDNAKDSESGVVKKNK